MQRFAVDPGSTDLGPVYFHPVLWICAVAVFAVIALQSIIYLRAIRKAASAADLTDEQIKSSVRRGGIAAIGPSLAVALVAISLLPLFGTPAVLTRIGLVGSAAFDVAAAGLAAQSLGAELGGPTYTQKVFAIGFAAMTLGGLVWMLTALVLTPLMAKGDKTLRKVNPAIMTVVPTAAILAAFFTLMFAETAKSGNHLLTVLVSGAVMALCLIGAKYLNKPWLREWGLGIAIFVALAAAFLATA